MSKLRRRQPEVAQLIHGRVCIRITWFGPIPQASLLFNISSARPCTTSGQGQSLTCPTLTQQHPLSTDCVPGSPVGTAVLMGVIWSSLLEGAWLRAGLQHLAGWHGCWLYVRGRIQKVSDGCGCEGGKQGVCCLSVSSADTGNKKLTGAVRCSGTEGRREEIWVRMQEDKPHCSRLAQGCP